MRIVDEEGAGLVFSHEPQHLLGITPREGRLIDGLFDDLSIAEQRNVPAVDRRRLSPCRIVGHAGAFIHVVRIGQPEGLIEAVVERSATRVNADVPFADVRSRIAAPLERRGDHDFSLRQAAFGTRNEHAPLSKHTAADRVTARQQRGSAGRAHLE